MTHPSLLYALCHHDDVVDAVLPHHPPEIILGAGQRALGGDVLPAEVVTLQHTHTHTEERGVSVCVRVCVCSVSACVCTYRYVAGVDVVGARVVLQVRQLQSGGVV